LVLFTRYLQDNQIKVNEVVGEYNRCKENEENIQLLGGKPEDYVR
jgi:hypothetical protein